ncbi:MAG: ubiquinone biosynthesis protein [Candidatus Tokpelaia sp. JSC188]|nr:MAG: ubiquinone biosynthesis protein [Candidatus Tokpelaia sp. JSC188]
MIIKIASSVRFIRASWVLAREGVISALPAEELTGLPSLGYWIAGLVARRKSRKANRSERISQAMNKLGPFYVKLGQFLATRPDIVGRDVASDLSMLQDRIKTFPTYAAITQIESSLNHRINDLFVKFGEPIAAASIAQVHPAWIRKDDGSMRKVAVKVIRPGLKQAFARDFKSLLLIANVAEQRVPSVRRLQPVNVLENLQQITRLEMDMRLEAAALSEMADNTAGDPGFRVPKIDWEYTGRNVLTMEWVDGIKILDKNALTIAGYNLNKIATTLMQSFLRHTLHDGFFHADMHPGNLFVDRGGSVVAVDFGIMGRLGKKEKRFFAEILYGFIQRDYRRISEIHFEAGYVPRYHDIASFAQANRAIGEPIHGQSVESISMSRLLALLFEITELFDMQIRPELLLLQKTMMVVEGVARSLDPKFNMWKAAEPVIGEWIIKNQGPSGFAKDINEGIKVFSDLVRRTPELIVRFDEITEGLQNISINGLHFDDDTIKRLANMQAQQKRSDHYALWIIAFCCIAIIFRLYPDLISYIGLGQTFHGQR